MTNSTITPTQDEEVARQIAERQWARKCEEHGPMLGAHCAEFHSAFRNWSAS